MRSICVAVALVALSVVACGADEAGTVDAPRVVDVDATEMAFDPASIDITPGETVEFVITNSGEVEHEFAVTNQEEVDEHLESGHEDEGHEGEGPAEVEVEPGATESLIVTFDDVDHMGVFVCLIEGHYEAGMHGAFDFEE